MGKFDLKELMAEGKVSKLDTGSNREQIEYIDIDLIDDDPNNFYELSNLDGLAANIELLGLQQPIRVRANPDDAARVIIVSGHRRRAAIRKLVDDGREDLRQIPCIRDKGECSPALQELRLIYANSDTRRLNSSDLSKQAERVEALLYQLKEEGYEFPGRMRDHVAEACNISKTKLARLKVIREKLNEIWQPSYEHGEIGESVAYELAQMRDTQQRELWFNRMTRGLPPKDLTAGVVAEAAERLSKIEALICKESGSPCANTLNKKTHALGLGRYVWCQCDKCCADCTNLTTCKEACPKLADKINQIKADQKMEKQRRALEQAEKDRPNIEMIQKLWYRFGEARMRANKDVGEIFSAIGRGYSSTQIQEAYELEAGEGKVSRNTCLPYGYYCTLSDVQVYVTIAQFLGCSLDWLLCLTDDPGGATVAAPERTGVEWYPASVEPKPGTEIVVVDTYGVADSGMFYNAATFETAGIDWPDVAFWTPQPTETTATAMTAAPPAEGWVPLQWIPGQEVPQKDKQLAIARFRTAEGGKPVRQIVQWDAASRQWCFPSHGATIDAECVKWFPLPAEEEAPDEKT